MQQGRRAGCPGEGAGTGACWAIGTQRACCLCTKPLWAPESKKKIAEGPDRGAPKGGSGGPEPRRATTPLNSGMEEQTVWWVLAGSESMVQQVGRAGCAGEGFGMERQTAGYLREAGAWLRG